MLRLRRLAREDVFLYPPPRARALVRRNKDWGGGFDSKEG